MISVLTAGDDYVSGRGAPGGNFVPNYPPCCATAVVASNNAWQNATHFHSRLAPQIERRLRLEHSNFPLFMGVSLGTGEEYLLIVSGWGMVYAYRTVQVEINRSPGESESIKTPQFRKYSRR